MAIWSPPNFDVTLRRDLRRVQLTSLSPEEAEAAEDEGALAGNLHYRDLRGLTWSEARQALALEQQLVERFASSGNPAQAEADFDEERGDFGEPEEELWGLDIGVAGAVLTLSALGATPVASCNAGAFGGHHQGSTPFIAFYLGRASLKELHRLAQAADLGLTADRGLGHLYGRSIDDLMNFARVAIAAHDV